MLSIKVSHDAEKLLLALNGRIDSDTCEEFIGKIRDVRDMHPKADIIFDCSELKYISGGGIHVLIALSHELKIKLISVLPEVKIILEGAGVLDMFEVTDYIREIQVQHESLLEDCGNYEIYSVNKNTVLKLFTSDISFDAVKREHANSHIALKSGIPSIIVYDIVRFEDRYGFLTERTDYKPVNAIIKTSPLLISRCAANMGKILSFMHSIEKIPDELPDTATHLRVLAGQMTKYLHEREIKFLINMIDAVPHFERFVHGNFTARNVFVTNDSALISDFGKMTSGNPIFDLGFLYMVNVLCADFLSNKLNGITPAQSRQLWQLFVQSYMGAKAKTRTAQMVIYITGLLMMTLYPATHDVDIDTAEKMIALARRDLFPAGEKLIDVIASADLKVFL